jgi:hypothetical protein
MEQGKREEDGGWFYLQAWLNEAQLIHEFRVVADIATMVVAKVEVRF